MTRPLRRSRYLGRRVCPSRCFSRVRTRAPTSNIQDSFALEQRLDGVEPALVVAALVIVRHLFDRVTELVERIKAFAEQSAIEGENAGLPFVMKGFSIRGRVD